MMAEENDVEKITSNISCKYRAYEALRVSHLNRQLNLAVGDFELTMNKCSEGEIICFDQRIKPALSRLRTELQSFLRNVRDASVASDELQETCFDLCSISIRY